MHRTWSRTRESQASTPDRGCCRCAPLYVDLPVRASPKGLTGAGLLLLHTPLPISAPDWRCVPVAGSPYAFSSCSSLLPRPPLLAWIETIQTSLLFPPIRLFFLLHSSSSSLLHSTPPSRPPHSLALPTHSPSPLYRPPHSTPTTNINIMLTPSAQSARAMALAVLSAHASHRYHDLVSWASRPLEQRIRSLVRPDQSNLKELLTLWDGQTSSCTATLPAQQHLEELITLHFELSAHQPTPPPPSIMNCTTWESAPVFQRELDAETVLALVPVGRFSPSELWGIVLLAEPVKGGGARAGTGVACEQAREFAWKYHHFMVISETDLTFSDSWRCLDNQSSLFTSPQQQQKEYPKQRSLPTVSTSLAPTPQNAYRSAVTAVEEDDSDDEYWGQYGDVEDSPTEESAHSGSTPFTRGFTMTVEEEEEDDDDEYWRKYGEAQGEEQDESDKKSKTTDEDPSSEVVAVRSFVDHDPRHVMPTDVTGSESGRILACVDDRAPRALSTLVAPVAAMPVPGQVNPTTLAMLLERLVAHNDDPSPDNDVGGTGNKDKDDAGEADVSLPLEEQVPRFTDNLPSSSSSPSSALSWSSSAGSRSRSQSLSTSISSTSTCTTATTITTSIKSATIAQDDSGAQTMSSVSSTSPGSAVSCTDSAFHEYCSPSIIAPDEFRKETKAEGAAAAAEPSASSTTATKESVRQSLQSAVRKASVSGLSKTELLEMLSVIYERQEQIIQA